MEEQKRSAGKGAEWGTIIVISTMETVFQLIAQP